MTNSSTLIFLIHQVQSALFETGIHKNRLSDPAEEQWPDVSPPERSVRAVLDFASAYEVADTTSVGKVEWLLN
ncbi:MAG: hypothetical protein KA780_02300 [Prolixibacteraceae bacterium]|jgi:hypothetical protein|nr:hypothetical protein [Prolixibacteraceae bacterium]NLX27709.1 hypothetical protein [Bacteroidales bacterium]HPJ78511.1 hypothetical protein [Prolixibacteraceae bacterium]HRV89686.1 hypothetical protein [Prolixibacteraceae bacterium]